jgi:hypothetical protein
MPQPFANLEGLLQLSRSEGVDIRPSLLRVLTDLYVQEAHHSREETRQYVELTLRLIPLVDEPTRTAVARKLRIYPHTPRELLARLGIAPGATWSPASPPAPAPEPDVTAPPASPNGAAPARNESPSAIGAAFLGAPSAERWQMLERLDEQEDGKAELLEVRPGTIERLEQAALQREQRLFARELQQSLGLSGRIAWEIVLDELGEPLLVTARVLGMAPEIVLRILMFLNPNVGHSVERVFALIRSYDQVTLTAAMRIMTSWQHASRLAPTAHFQPLHAPDGAASLDSARENARRGTQHSGEHTESRPAVALTGRVQRTN